MSMGIASRKKGGPLPGESEEATALTSKKGTRTWKATPYDPCWHYGMRAMIIFNIILAVGLFLHRSPKLKAAGNEQLIKISQSLKEQQAKLAAQYTALSSKISLETEDLIVKLDETDEDTSVSGTVTKSHHEEEVGKIQSSYDKKISSLQSSHEGDAAQANIDIEKLKAEIESHKETLDAAQQKAVDELEAEIERNMETLKTIKSKINGMKVDSTLFCDECKYNYNDLRTSCLQRKNFLMKRHGDTEEIAREAVIAMDPNCMKAQA